MDPISSFALKTVGGLASQAGTAAIGAFSAGGNVGDALTAINRSFFRDNLPEIRTTLAESDNAYVRSRQAASQSIMDQIEGASKYMF